MYCYGTNLTVYSYSKIVLYMHIFFLILYMILITGYVFLRSILLESYLNKELCIHLVYTCRTFDDVGCHVLWDVRCSGLLVLWDVWDGMFHDGTLDNWIFGLYILQIPSQTPKKIAWWLPNKLPRYLQKGHPFYMLRENLNSIRYLLIKLKK